MHANAPAFRRRAAEAGFTYVGLLVSVVLLGLMLGSVGTVWRTNAQREREKQLLFIGHEFETAIAAYYAAGGNQLPQEIDDLLEDKRWPTPRHFLRKAYADPMTRQNDWTLIRGDSTGIIGIASSSSAVPIKKSGFRPDEEGFADAQTYQDWRFVFTPHIGRRRVAAYPVTGN